MVCRKKVLTIWFTSMVLLTGLAALEHPYLTSISPLGSGLGTTIVVDDGGGQDYVRIQWAIDNASDGDTIRVYSGWYNESLLIEGKSLTIRGSGMDSTVINGSGIDTTSLEIKSNNNNISNFAIHNGSVGILLNGSDGNHILKINSTLNSFAGIVFNGSSNSSIEDSIFNDNKFGVKINDSTGNVLRNNTCNSNLRDGINITNSNNHILQNNTLRSNNENGIYLGFTNWTRINHSHVRSNSKTGDFGGIMFYFSNNNSVENSTLVNNGDRGNVMGNGFYGAASHHNILRGNNVSDNFRFGIFFEWGSHNNRVTNNLVTSNTQGVGILLLSGCSNNLIDNNSAVKNFHSIFLQGAKKNIVENNSGSHSIDQLGGGAGLVLQSDGNLNTVIHNTFTLNPSSGVITESSNNNLIRNNTCDSNTNAGVAINSDSDDNKVIGNHITNNSGTGIAIFDAASKNNVIHSNILIKNNGVGGVQGQDDGGGNAWDDNAGRGNFWSDYRNRFHNASHNGHTWNMSYEMDGIGGGEDRFPLAFLPTPELDEDPPAFLDDNTSGNATTGDFLNFSVNISDDVGFRVVRLNYSYDGVKFSDMPMKYFGDYNWYRNVLINSSATGLEYHFHIEDYLSNNVTTNVKPVIVLDNDRPEFVLDHTPNSTTTGDNITFAANFTDNIEVDFVNVTYTYDNVDFHNVSMNNTGGRRWERVVNISPDAGSLEYYYYFGDNSSNTNNTEAFRIPVTDNDRPLLLSDRTPDVGTTGDIFYFDANFTDNIGVESVNVNFTYGYGELSKALPNIGGERWNVSVTLPENGTDLEYYFTVVDKAGNLYETDPRDVNISDNDKPILLDDPTPEDPTTGDNFTFSGNFSDNIELETVELNYTYDGLTFFERTMKKIVTRGGIERYSVDITVAYDAEYLEYRFDLSDTSGNTNITSAETLFVSDNDKPVVHAGDDIRADEGDMVRFNGSTCTDNIGIDSYIWTFTYDDVPRELKGREPRFRFDVIGSYEVTLNVTDRAGNWATDSLVVHVNDTSPPAAIAGEDRYGRFGERITLDGVASHDNVRIVEYRWSFVYNSTEKELMGRIVNFSFYAVGIFEITLTVEDSSGLEGQDTVKIIIEDLTPPVTSAGEDVEVRVGERVVLNGSASSDNVGITNYTWSFTYNGSPVDLYGVAPEFTFHISGDYDIELTVTDIGDNLGKDELTVKVRDGGGDDTDDDTDDTTPEYDEGDETPPREEKGGFPTWLWWIVGVILVLAVIGAVMVLVVTKRKKKEKRGKIGTEEEVLSEGAPQLPEEGGEDGAPGGKIMDREIVEEGGGVEISKEVEDKTSPETLPDRAPVCLTCGQPSQYYPDYFCYWCDTCQDYVYPGAEAEEKKELPDSATGAPVLPATTGGTATTEEENKEPTDAATEAPALPETTGDTEEEKKELTGSDVERPALPETTEEEEKEGDEKTETEGSPETAESEDKTEGSPETAESEDKTEGSPETAESEDKGEGESSDVVERPSAGGVGEDEESSGKDDPEDGEGDVGEELDDMLDDLFDQL